MRRILIGGTGSGCGKTTVTCAILQALHDRGLPVAAFKCGPDYIDPMFYEAVLGKPAYHLDSFFCGADTLRFLLREGSKGAGLAVIEGVMGFYDGAAGKGSAHSVCQCTGTPAVLVIDCKGMRDSIGAVMQGFLRYQTPNRIAGFLFNRLPEKLAPFAESLCKTLGTAYFGFLPPHDLTLKSRRLGLVPAAEIDGLMEKLQRLGALAEQTVLLDRLLALPDAPLPPVSGPKIPSLPFRRPPVIAVARDRAFCFTYAENLSLLEALGCRIEFFSPLEDQRLPAQTTGLLLGGGYPERHAKQLSENRPLREEIRAKVQGGMPTIAECGGFLYLQSSLEDAWGCTYPMAGVFPGKGFRTNRLQRFGYVTMTAEQDTLLCPGGEPVLAHGFHYWDVTDPGITFTAVKSDGSAYRCIHAGARCYAGFPHLYFYSNWKQAARFAQQCGIYGGVL